MIGATDHGFWLDVNHERQADWAVNYLRKKGILDDGGYLLSSKALSQWLEQERAQPHSELLMLMKNAWDQVQRRNADRSKKMKRLNTLISAQAMKQFQAFRKSLKTTNSNALEMLLTAESDRAAALDVKLKKAQEETKQLKSKLKLLNKKLHTCIIELSDRSVLMEDARISFDDITEEQKSRSKQLFQQLLNDLFSSDLASKLDIAFHDRMERP